MRIFCPAMVADSFSRAAGYRWCRMSPLRPPRSGVSRSVAGLRPWQGISEGRGRSTVDWSRGIGPEWMVAGSGRSGTDQHGWLDAPQLATAPRTQPVYYAASYAGCEIGGRRAVRPPAPDVLLDDLRNPAGADGAAALANREL